MVEKKLIQDTIVELMDANIDKDTIYATLKDIGVGEEDIENNYAEVLENRKTESKPETTPQEEKEVQEEEEEITEEEQEDSAEEEQEETSPEKEDIFTKPEKEEPSKKTTKTDFLEKNKSRDEDVLEAELKKTTSNVNDINKEDIFKNIKKEKSTSTSNIDAKQLSEIEEQVRELKAQMNGLTKIMKDILEENRNILNKLK